MFYKEVSFHHKKQESDYWNDQRAAGGKIGALKMTAFEKETATILMENVDSRITVVTEKR